MKKRSILLLVTSLAIVFTSCNKKDENLPFNQLSVEENKAVVESSAIEAARTFDEMKDHAVIDATVNLGINLNTSDPLSSRTAKKSKFTKTINTIGAMGSGEAGINELFAEMAEPGEFAEDPESIQEIWNEVVGTYTWNPGTESWDYEENTDAIVFLFPSTPDGTTNNATLTIYNYEGVVISSPIDDEYTGDLPVSLNMEMEIEGTIVMTYTFAVEYNEGGIPSSVASDLTLTPYRFTVDATNNDKEISATYQFTNDGDIVLIIQGGVEGDFTQENIDANTHTYSETYEWTDYEWNDQTQHYDEVTVTETYEWEELDIGEVVHTGRIKFQLYNVSVGGIGNITAIADSLKLIYPDDYWNDPGFDEQAAVQGVVNLMNAHLKIYAIDEDANKKIADVEAYVVTETDGMYTDYWVGFRLVFGDGSLVDLDTYFEEGFEDFVTEINGIITDLNNKYDLQIDPVEY